MTLGTRIDPPPTQATSGRRAPGPVTAVVQAATRPAQHMPLDAIAVDGGTLRSRFQWANRGRSAVRPTSPLRTPGGFWVRHHADHLARPVIHVMHCPRAFSIDGQYA